MKRKRKQDKTIEKPKLSGVYQDICSNLDARLYLIAELCTSTVRHLPDEQVRDFGYEIKSYLQQRRAVDSLIGRRVHARYREHPDFLEDVARFKRKMKDRED